MKKNVKVEEKKNMFSIFSSNGIVRNAKKILLAGTIICGLTLVPTDAMAKEPQRRGGNQVRVEKRDNRQGNRKEMHVGKINNRAPQRVHAKPAHRPVSHHAPAPRPVVHHAPAPRPVVHHVHAPRPVVHHHVPPVHVTHHPVHHVHHCNSDVANAAAVVIGVAGLISLLAQ